MMTLDPQARDLLEQLASAGGHPLETLPAEQAREAVMGLRDLAGPPQAVAAVRDLIVPGPAGGIPIRVYTPKGAGPSGIVMYFHGGCFVMGSIEFVDAPCRSLANAARALVVSVGYRLAPEHAFPAAPDDCYAATSWVAEHAAELGGDGRIVVAGDSAGGNLAAVVALMARDRNGPDLVGQLLIYPATDAACDSVSYDENADGYLLTKALMQWGWEQYLSGDDDRRHAYASPLRTPDLSGLPAAYVITAEFDPLRDEGRAYADRLRQAGVAVELKHYEGMIHGFWQLGGVLDEGRAAVEAAGAYLQALLAPPAMADPRRPERVSP